MGEVAHVDGTDIQIVAYVLVTEGSEGCPELEVVAFEAEDVIDASDDLERD